MTTVSLERITKNFGRTVALREVDLKIQAGELFFLLGPSGCGKSTLLRIIAGLHAPTSGRVLFNGQDVTNLGTQGRNAVMCFQNYALWPHMSVRDNVRFGLDVRKLPPDQRDARVEQMLTLVQMSEYAERKPNELSGGQQQRVALARALAVEPACLLLDEPLSNLDAKLRHEMRGEIRRICKTAGCTTVYVTHSQEEALSIADQIAVMNSGRVLQVGTPGDLYHRPTSSFVADFIGHTNLFSGKVVARDGDAVRIETPAGVMTAQVNGQSAQIPPVVILSVRPEHMRIVTGSAAPPPRINRFNAKSVESSFLGESSEHVLQVGPQRIRVISMPPRFDMPSDVQVEFDPRDVLILPR
jgi:iron(III) transport system ATP-binding protein